MPRSTRRAALAVLATVLCTVTATAACAAELRVLTAGAFKPVLLAAQPAFEQRTGHRLRIDNDTAGGLQKRIQAGEAFDLVISSATSLQAAAGAAALGKDAPVPLARVGIAVAVAPGRPRPDISTPEAFRCLLLDARAVAYVDPAAGGTSGVYLEGLFKTMGISEQVLAKAVKVPGGLSAQRLLSGEADVAVQQASELLAVPEAVMVGPLPAAIQSYTVYAAALGAAPADAAAVRQLLDWLRSDTVGEVLRAKGMDRPDQATSR